MTALVNGVRSNRNDTRPGSPARAALSLAARAKAVVL